MRKALSTLASVVLLTVATASLLAQSSKTSGTDFLIDVNRPFVYVNFDRIGLGIPRDTTEPNSRIWLRLRNNCRLGIVVRANGLPDGSPKDEVGLEYEVVANPATNVFSFSTPNADKRESGQSGNSQTEKIKSDEISRGYMEEAASSVTIGPGQEILFSMPINHLSKQWHVEIPFDFGLPPGKGPLSSNTVGLPVMAVHYAVWDLPRNAQAEVWKR
jgi:hypothetical protein